MVFKITNKDFFEDNPSAKWINEFNQCTSDQMKYVLFVYAYDTPFRKLSTEDRKHRALTEIGIKKDGNRRFPTTWRKVMANEIPQVRNAIMKLREITRDDDSETLEAYDAQLDQFRALMRKPNKSDKEVDQAMKIAKDFPSFLENRKKVMEILELRQDEVFTDEDEVDNEFSTVEEFLDEENEEV